MSQVTTCCPDSGSDTPLPGTEIVRFFYAPYAAIVSVRDDGTIWCQTLMRPEWHHRYTRKPERPLDEWTNAWRRKFDEAPAWARETTELPSYEDLQQQMDDGVCEAPTGHSVEPDGVGPDGVPSWPRLFAII